jgi:O-methyltransferase
MSSETTLRRRLGRPARRLVQQALGRFDLRLAPLTPQRVDDIPEADQHIYEMVRDRTMTTPASVWALVAAVRYVVDAGIQGDVVECGVWRGGSMMAVAHTLLEQGDVGRGLHLFDTFEGMPEPTDKDVLWSGASASDLMVTETGANADMLWARASLEDVTEGMSSTGYPEELVHCVRGRVEETIPGRAPDRIALLRLDTDWYESSKHELEHLYARLSPGGVLILDDYAWWKGARRATDEYFAAHPPAPLLVRVDDSGMRIAVKAATG